MNVYCLIHKKEPLRITRYSKYISNRRERYTTTVKTNWMFCEKCDLMYKVKVTVKAGKRMSVRV